MSSALCDGRPWHCMFGTYLRYRWLHSHRSKYGKAKMIEDFSNINVDMGRSSKLIREDIWKRLRSLHFFERYSYPMEVGSHLYADSTLSPTTSMATLTIRRNARAQSDSYHAHWICSAWGAEEMDDFSHGFKWKEHLTENITGGRSITEASRKKLSPRLSGCIALASTMLAFISVHDIGDCRSDCFGAYIWANGLSSTHFVSQQFVTWGNQ